MKHFVSLTSHHPLGAITDQAYCEKKQLAESLGITD